MSEPTYRVELTHHPEMPLRPWQAEIHRCSDDGYMAQLWGESRQIATELAGAWVWRQKYGEPPSTVFLTEEGEIHDRHEAGVLRDANA